MGEEASDFEALDELLDGIRRGRFADGLRCVHCGAAHVRRHGFVRRRQRYRCMRCRRTYSDLTGTAMAYSKRPLDWGAYAACMDEGLTIREAAERLDMSVATSFRWRHALLSELAVRDRTGLNGHIELTDLWFPLSEKGRRDLDRPPRHRGVRYRHRFEGEVVRVIVACDRIGGCVSSVARTSRVLFHHLRDAIAWRIRSAKALYARHGPLSPTGRFAQSLGIELEPVGALRGGPARAEVHLHTVTSYADRLLGWLRRFNGVATKYLPHYLIWHRRIDPSDCFSFARAVVDWVF